MTRLLRVVPPRHLTRPIAALTAALLAPVQRAAAQEANALTQSLEVTAGRITQTLTELWYLKLFSAGETEISLNQIVIALLVVLIGVMISRRVTRVVQHRLVRVQRIDVHAAALIQKLLFYTLVVIVVLVALPIAGIPITIFTVLSGAIAIGVGLGAQDLFRNLIAGLTLMIEKPIRIGDIVQVGEHEGRIEEIGNRVTRVRRTDGIDVLVPNDQFLAQPVVNWTLFDNSLRGSVVVGVAYGSPTDEVAAILERCAREHEKVLRDPEPAVLFQDFGADALVFEVFFWTRITRPMDLRRVCSDVRFRVDAECRAHGITIAFPQRDVHVNAVRPIEVKVVGDAGAGPAQQSAV